MAMLHTVECNFILFSCGKILSFFKIKKLRKESVCSVYFNYRKFYITINKGLYRAQGK